MIYGDGELKMWWERLTNFERMELFDRVTENATSPYIKNKFAAMKRQWDMGHPFSPSQLAEIRKWER